MAGEPKSNPPLALDTDLLIQIRNELVAQNLMIAGVIDEHYGKGVARQLVQEGYEESEKAHKSKEKKGG